MQEPNITRAEPISFTRQSLDGYSSETITYLDTDGNGLFDKVIKSTLKDPRTKSGANNSPESRAAQAASQASDNISITETWIITGPAIEKFVVKQDNQKKTVILDKSTVLADKLIALALIDGSGTLTVTKEKWAMLSHNRCESDDVMKTDLPKKPN